MKTIFIYEVLLMGNEIITYLWIMISSITVLVIFLVLLSFSLDVSEDDQDK
ncbi:hypothetical protein D3C79_128530 [compost metagenome]